MTHYIKNRQVAKNAKFFSWRHFDETQCKPLRSWR